MTALPRTELDPPPSRAARAPSTAGQLPAAPRSGWRARLTRSFLDRVVRRVPVSVREADGGVLGARNETARANGVTALPEIVITDPDAFYARVGRSPMIGLGESYMAAEWHAADDTDLADALTPFAERLTGLVPPVFYRLRHLVMPTGLNPENSRRGARSNIEAHYDLSNDMFAAFLDETMSYSSAWFDTLDPAPSWEGLEPAQLRKVDAILDAAGVAAGSRVLEIGTGWGTLAIRAAERGAQVTSVTLSREQADLARKRIAAAGVSDRVEVAVRDYREQEGSFDAVVSVEMIEAVGEKYWPEYFARIDRLLAPGGRVAIQAILLEHDRMVATRNTYTWMHKYIFPGGLLPSLQAIREITTEHTSLRVTGADFLGPHYAHTLRLWRERFLAQWDSVAALGFGDTFRRMWEFYLAYCEAGFRAGYIDVAQVRLAREG